MIKIIWIGCFVLLLFSCKRDASNGTPIELETVEDEIKDYFLFNSGSYWVYQDTFSLQNDSIYAVASATTIDSLRFANGGLAAVWETISTTYGSSLTGDTLISWCRPSEKVGTQWKVRKQRQVNSITIGSAIAAILPFDSTSTESLDGVSWITSEASYDSLVVGDSLYFDVVEFANSADSTVAGNSTRHFYARGVGLIRFVNFATGAVWDLDRFSVSQ
jgi:hypothetical protein